jgi:hypothetical protein
MEKESKTLKSTQGTAESQAIFVDPIRKPLIGSVFALLFAALVPLWPIDGNWLGVPAWAVFALFMSVLLSVFTAYVLLRIWQDPEDSAGENHDGIR